MTRAGAAGVYLNAPAAICALGELTDAAEAMLAGRSGLRSRAEGEPWFGRWPEAIDRAARRRAEAAAPSYAAARVFRGALHVAAESLCRAEIPPGEIALVLSTTKAAMDGFETSYRAAFLNETPGGDAAPGDLYNPAALAEALAATLALGGEVLAVSSACASGLAAMAQAARMLRSGRARHVLVVGVDCPDGFIRAGFASLKALAAGPCRPFDARRDGLCLGEAAAAVIISGQSQPAGARLDGIAMASDANHITGPSRTGEAMAAAIAEALAQAGWSFDELDMINAHGTGTLFNDQSETLALARCLADGATMAPVYSLKGSIGHTLGAAGVLECLLAVEFARRGAAPPTVGFETLGVEPALPVSARPVRRSIGRLLTMKSGFGGVNAAAAVSLDAVDEGSRP